jgi:serine/threonine-protein kinase HipA
MNLKAKHAQTLQVSMSGEVVGTLAQSERGQIWFEYDPTWIKTGFAVSPMASFELKSGAFKATNNNFDGLHGVFNDSLPDGWGLLLMDRALKNKFGWDVHEITPLDRLAYIGNRAMGALEFKPTTETSAFASTPPIADLYEDALLVQEGRADEVMRALSILGGSPGGARPKITLALDSQGSDFVMSGFENIPANFDHWIVKFRSQNTDPICMGRVEMAYAEMAVLAKVDIPPHGSFAQKSAA